MKSPFPGMDPYLESYWGDVHTSLVTYARDQLRPQLPKDLRVRVEEHVTAQPHHIRHYVGSEPWGLTPPFTLRLCFYLYCRYALQPICETCGSAAAVFF